MDLANSDNAIRVAEPPPVTAISQQSTDSSCEGFPLYLPAPELVIESIEVVDAGAEAEAGIDARSCSVLVQKSKSILDALLSIEGVWALSPTLHEESDPESASDSYQRFRAQLHGEISALAREAESKLGAGTASFLIAERTESFIKKHVLKALDRWDRQLGKTNEESLSTESTGWVSGIENQALARVHHALLSWLDGMGIMAFHPEAEPFNELLHHRHSQVYQSTIPPGLIFGVLRLGYLRDGKLLRRAQVVVTR